MKNSFSSLGVMLAVFVLVGGMFVGGAYLLTLLVNPILRFYILKEISVRCMLSGVLALRVIIQLCKFNAQW